MIVFAFVGPKLPILESFEVKNLFFFVQEIVNREYIEVLNRNVFGAIRIRNINRNFLQWHCLNEAIPRECILFNVHVIYLQIHKNSWSGGHYFKIHCLLRFGGIAFTVQYSQLRINMKL